MIGHVIIGRPKAGKSTFLRKLLTNFKGKRIVYDVNNEYSDIYKEPFLDIDDFCKKYENQTDSMIAFEEATIFFNSRSTNPIANKKMVRRRHERNYIVFCFHSWRAVPSYLLDLTNYITIFKTNDIEKKVLEKTSNESILDAYYMVQASANPHEKITIKF